MIGLIIAVGLSSLILIVGTLSLFQILTQTERRSYQIESNQEYKHTGEKIRFGLILEAPRGFRHGEKAYVDYFNFPNDAEMGEKILSNAQILALAPQHMGDGILETDMINLFNKRSREEKPIHLTRASSLTAMLADVSDEEIRPKLDFTFQQQNIEVERSWKAPFVLGVIALLSLAFTAVSGLESLTSFV